MKDTPLFTVTVVQVRGEHLRDRMIVRRHGSTDPWRRIDATIDGDGGHGIEDVIVAGGGNPEAEGDTEQAQWERWPFARTRHHAFPERSLTMRAPLEDHRFHWDDVALVFLVPDRDGAAEEWDHELYFCDRHSLWDVQVLTRSPLAYKDGEFQMIQEAA